MQCSLPSRPPPFIGYRASVRVESTAGGSRPGSDHLITVSLLIIIYTCHLFLQWFVLVPQKSCHFSGPGFHWDWKIKYVLICRQQDDGVPWRPVRWLRTPAYFRPRPLLVADLPRAWGACWAGRVGGWKPTQNSGAKSRNSSAPRWSKNIAAGQPFVAAIYRSLSWCAA
jgi:hypothetical protein